MTTVQDKLLTIAESVKQRFPIATDHIDFVVQTATVISSSISKVCFITCENAKETANGFKSHANDKTHMIRQKISDVEIKVKERVIGAKGVLSSYLDKIVLAVSDVLLRAPAAFEPFFLYTLDKSRPYIVRAVSIAKPYVKQTITAGLPVFERVKPSLLVYMEKIKTVIESNQFWAENVDIAVIKVTQSARMASTFCGLDDLYDEEGKVGNDSECEKYHTVARASSDDKGSAPKHTWMDCSSPVVKGVGVTTTETIPQPSSH